MKLKRTIFPINFLEFIIDIHVQRKDKRSNKLLIHRRV
jgi:hypothetical protein